MKKFIRNNLKVIIAFIIGLIISGGMVYATTTIASSDVAYTSNGQSTVQGALNDLYIKAQNAGIDSNSIDFATLKTNTTKAVLASNKGVCINRNNKLNCFKINNWEEEQNHIQQVFSDISCYVGSSDVTCDASGFDCSVYSDGDVNCIDRSDYSGCGVGSSGSVDCW